ncbi:TadE-like protein [Posidoniimonas polymericola]|uniref:TadE-like protein n=1 Tax=Posidoniimonas polymericola TaxID=2528002 RepID=A0A5C5ZFG1_9BACT|nr:TadE/TadG family type IV pilus assembly protein [Posidoniimonas polymericola]TWT85293.1 TadE-like protein [Posidoniimonas polymericola]
MSNRTKSKSRRGVVAVEFAVVAPVLLSITFAMIELNRSYESQNLLATAAREGARFASMDRDGMLGQGEDANAKLVSDVKTFLESNGLPRDSITVEVKDAEYPETDFDIEDPANDLRLFEVRVSIDYSEVSHMAVDPANDYAMSASVFFRNGRATISD